MSVLVKGLMHIFGPSNSGKTWFGLSASGDPKKIVFLDGDSAKGKEAASIIGIPKDNYHNLTLLGAEKEGLTEIEYHIALLEIIKEIKAGQDVILFDNPAEFFKSAHSYVDLNRSKFRKRWSSYGPIIGPQVWNEVRKSHLPRVYTLLQSKADLVIFATHTKNQTVDGVKTGATEPDADESLRTEAGMVVRLGRDTRNSHTHAPVGLVIKRPLPRYDPAKRDIINILPERIAPCTWKTIEEYLKNPVGTRKLETHEIPDDFEYDLIRGTLNPEQQRIYEFNREMKRMQIDQEMSEAVVAAAANVEETNPIVRTNQILALVKDEYPDLTPTRVQQILDKAGEVANGKAK